MSTLGRMDDHQNATISGLDRVVGVADVAGTLDRLS